MLLRPPRSRWIDPAVRNVLLTISAALIGTAVGGVGVLSVVTAMTQPPNPGPPARDAGAIVAARWPVVITSPHETEGAGRAPTDRTAAASPGPANLAPQDPKPQNAAPDPLLGSAAEAGQRAGDQTPAAQPGSSNDRAGTNGSDKPRHARSKRLAGGGSIGDRSTRQSGGNDTAANFTAAQRRGPASRQLYDFSSGGNYRDDRYASPPRAPRGAMIQQDGGQWSGGWGSPFGGGHWGDYRY